MRLRFAPGVDQLIHYERGWLRGDLLAGITVAAYLIPQVMAYAELAGLPAVAGLWAVIGAMTVYAVLGSSRQLSVGPESTTALMTATALAPLADGDSEHYAALAAGLALIVGAIALVGFIARLGFLADLLSKPVLVGYLAGVAVIMIAGQLEKFSGVPIDDDNPLKAIWHFLTHLGEIHTAT
ncbi:MAG TPA: SulP family inorganic anion transporter, partial [Ilumatobacter sp.]